MLFNFQISKPLSTWSWSAYFIPLYVVYIHCRYYFTYHFISFTSLLLGPVSAIYQLISNNNFKFQAPVNEEAQYVAVGSSVAGRCALVGEIVRKKTTKNGANKFHRCLKCGRLLRSYFLFVLSSSARYRGCICCADNSSKIYSSRIIERRNKGGGPTRCDYLPISR